MTLSGRRFCPLCATWSEAFRGDRHGTPDRACPRCAALERHRFLALLVPALVRRHDVSTVLDVAPSGPLSALVDALVPHRIGTDLDPAADGRTVGVQASLTALPLADGCVDLVLCSHVLEHVPDDAAAIAEIARVLAPGGVGVVAVPWRPDRPTDEDPGAPVEERVRRFGQGDHVRYYGGDVGDRLTAGGLAWSTLTPGSVLPPAVVRTCAFAPDETFWLVRRAGDPASGDALVPDLADELTGGLLRTLGEADAVQSDAVAEQRSLLRHSEQRRLRALEAAARSRAQYERLTGRLPVRIGLAGWTVVKAARSRLPQG